MEYLNNIVVAIFSNTTFLVVWFLTNAYYEYFSKILPFLFKSYEIYIKENKFIYYSNYLENNNIFFSKMLSCPFCIGFWSSIIFCIIYKVIFYICVIYIASLLMYFFIKQLCCN